MTDEKRNRVDELETPTRTRATRKQLSNTEQRSRSTESEQTTPKKQFWVQIRLLPIWLRIVLVLLLLAGAAILGAIIGYGYVGDGQPADVLKKETWTHILDIINGKES
ncbi:DNA-directed RNA polymerase subunit beta [Sporosarcina beigongshangi]|uniref:DNA-directed RNA polymerase subunit beta n=1 Tax=Sporosarcina beigongshangi TaxID=2782538 RepID=UPI00193A4ED7|nr:DNA-directed RNA polymerase subunit beta [Sporosarcina beigongshangi]